MINTNNLGPVIKNGDLLHVIKKILYVGIFVLIIIPFTGCGRELTDEKSEPSETTETHLTLRRKIASEEMLRARNELCRAIKVIAHKSYIKEGELNRERYRFSREFRNKQSLIYSISKQRIPNPPFNLIEATREYAFSNLDAINEVDKYRVKIAKIYANYLLDVGQAGASFSEVNDPDLMEHCPCKNSYIDGWVSEFQYKGDWREPIIKF